ncbi:MAG TPA: acyl-CoA dehydrogenase family protein, partial [Rhodoferax sp.]
ASLKMSAVLHHDPAGDYYLVNGQKTWTTLGHYANKIFCLVRTNREARPQEGISFLLIDMRSPGIDIRPIITLDGEHEVSEVFFTDVRVPAENLVGQQDKGWNCAKYLLTYERTGQAGVGLSMAALERLKRIAGSIACDGQKLLNEPLFASQVGRIEIALESMKTTNLRIVAAVAGGGVPGVESSMLKIKGSEIRQEILSLTRKALGPRALELQMDSMNSFGHETLGIHNAANEYFNNRKLSIFGGSTEIQKNIISKILIGL